MKLHAAGEHHAGGEGCVPAGDQSPETSMMVALGGAKLSGEHARYSARVGSCLCLCE